MTAPQRPTPLPEVPAEVPAWSFGTASPYVDAGADLYVVVETDDDRPVRLVRAVGPFDSLDRGEQWADDNVGGTYAVVPFEIAPGDGGGT